MPARLHRHPAQGDIVEARELSLGKHFVGGPDAELVGQPSSFDVLTFDDRCRAQRLTRYEYRSVIEGRPSFDSLSVLNAGRIMDAPDEGRTCGGDELEVRPLGR